MGCSTGRSAPGVAAGAFEQGAPHAHTTSPNTEIATRTSFLSAAGRSIMHLRYPAKQRSACTRTRRRLSKGAPRMERAPPGGTLPRSTNERSITALPRARAWLGSHRALGFDRARQQKVLTNPVIFEIHLRQSL